MYGRVCGLKFWCKYAFNRAAVAVIGVSLRCLKFAIPKTGRTRSLWTGTPIINLATNARAERKLGVDSKSLVYDTFFVTSEFDLNLSGWMRIPFVRYLLPYIVFVWAMLRYQRFHFFYDRGLLPPLERFQFNPYELAILRRMNKQVFFWTYGADVRTRDRTQSLGNYNCCSFCPSPGSCCVCDDRKGMENFRRTTEAATAAFSMGDMIEYTPGSRNDLFFWPVDLESNDGTKYTPRFPSVDRRGPIRIVHAPNHREFKGTQFLLDAVDQIRADGIEIDLQLVERVPNATALEIYRSADLVFDQCIIGFHGYFAIEAMAIGKPVMVFIRKREEYLLHSEECPLINVSAENVEHGLRELIQNRRQLHAIGVASRRYVERHFSLDAFASRLGAVYTELGV